MNTKKIDSMLDTIDEIVNLPGMTWQEKKRMVQDQMSEDHGVSLGEFASWFADSEG